MAIDVRAKGSLGAWSDTDAWLNLTSHGSLGDYLFAIAAITVLTVPARARLAFSGAEAELTSAAAGARLTSSAATARLSQ